MSNQTPFFQAYCQVGSKVIPAQPGSSLDNPSNYIIPPIVGNQYQWNYGVGPRQAVVDINFIVRDVADEALGPTLMGMFFNRVAYETNPTFDTTAISGGIVYWDGATGFTLGGIVKAEAFTLAMGSKDDPIILACRFLANSATVLGSAPEGITTSWSSAPPLYGNAVTFSGGLANLPWDFSLSYANNHTPNKAMNGSVYPLDFNAGIPTAGFRQRVQAGDSVPANGTSIGINIAGSTLDPCLFTIVNPLDNTPDSRRVSMPRVFREHTYYCLGAAGRDSADGTTNNAPLTCSINGTAVGG